MRIGVVMPTYNQAAYLPEALASTLGQTMPPDRFELLVVDDSSTDATGPILRDWPELASFWLIHASGKRGCGRAINLGFAVFGGMLGYEPDAWSWVSSDNVMYPHWLETLSEALKPGVGAVYSAYDRQEGSKTITVRPGPYSRDRLLSSDACYFGPSFLIRAEIWRAAGDHEGGSAHDYGHWARVEEACWAAGMTIEYVDEPLCLYRTHEEQTVKRRPDLYDAPDQRREAMERRSKATQATRA